MKSTSALVFILFAGAGSPVLAQSRMRDQVLEGCTVMQSPRSGRVLGCEGPDRVALIVREEEVAGTSPDATIKRRMESMRRAPDAGAGETTTRSEKATWAQGVRKGAVHRYEAVFDDDARTEEGAAYVLALPGAIKGRVTVIRCDGTGPGVARRCDELLGLVASEGIPPCLGGAPEVTIAGVPKVVPKGCCSTPLPEPGGRIECEGATYITWKPAEGALPLIATKRKGSLACDVLGVATECAWEESSLGRGPHSRLHGTIGEGEAATQLTCAFQQSFTPKAIPPACLELFRLREK